MAGEKENPPKDALEMLPGLFQRMTALEKRVAALEARKGGELPPDHPVAEAARRGFKGE